MSDISGVSTGWVTAGVSMIIAALSSAVAFLFKLRENENTRAIKELKETHAASIAELKTSNATATQKADRCEQDRAELFAKCAVLETKLGNVEEKLSKIDIEGTQFSHRKQA